VGTPHLSVPFNDYFANDSILILEHVSQVKVCKKGALKCTGFCSCKVQCVALSLFILRGHFMVADPLSHGMYYIPSYVGRSRVVLEGGTEACKSPKD
jgi:hypothetical protein